MLPDEVVVAVVAGQCLRRDELGRPADEPVVEADVGERVADVGSGGTSSLSSSKCSVVMRGSARSPAVEARLSHPSIPTLLGVIPC